MCMLAIEKAAVHLHNNGTIGFGGFNNPITVFIL